MISLIRLSGKYQYGKGKDFEEYSTKINSYHDREASLSLLMDDETEKTNKSIKYLVF